MLNVQLERDCSDVARWRGTEELREAGVIANALAQCGRVADAELLMATAEAEHHGVAPVHPFAAVHGYLTIQGSGEIDAAYQQQLDALAEPGAVEDPRTFNEILSTVIMCAHVRGNPAWWAVAVEAGARRQELLDPVNEFTLDSYSHFEKKKWVEGSERWRLVETGALAGPAWKGTTLRVAAANLNWRVDETRGLDALFTRFDPLRHGLGAVTFHFAFSRRHPGRWRERGAQARSALDAIAGRGLHYLEARLRGFLSVTDAYLGDLGRATEYAIEAAAWAGPRGFKLVLEDTRHARTVMALARADFDSAYAIAIESPIEAHRWEISGHGAAELLNLAEACHGVGRPQDAVPAVTAAIERGLDAQTPRQGMALRVAQALLEPDDDAADRLFLSAVALEEAAASPFDAARVRLAYGGFLAARRHDPKRAGAQLERAHELFEDLGTAEWAARAARELEIARGAAHAARTSVPHLSPRELLIASYAAQGLSNKEIAVRLHISARTVSYHLYNAFPKLGVVSRAALRDALTSLEMHRRR